MFRLIANQWLMLMRIADPIKINDEERKKLQSVEILLADPRLFSHFDFSFSSLKWLQSLTAGKRTICLL